MAMERPRLHTVVARRTLLVPRAMLEDPAIASRLSERLVESVKRGGARPVMVTAKEDQVLGAGRRRPGGRAPPLTRRRRTRTAHPCGHIEPESLARGFATTLIRRDIARNLASFFA